MTRLKECREKAGLSQKYVALTLGVAAPSVSNWERGKTTPTPENMIQLADLYNVSLDYLLNRTDEPHEAEQEDTTLKTAEARTVSGWMDSLPEERRQLLLNIVQSVIKTFPEYPGQKG